MAESCDLCVDIVYDHCSIYFGANQDKKVVSEYDQEIPQSQTAGKPMAPRERATQQS